MKKIRQISQYDKVFKENIESALPMLLERVLDIHPVSTEEIPDDLQSTIERKPDFLKKITDVSQQTFILHIEFQLADDAEMVYRMHEYYALLLRKYRLSVRQFVFFIGNIQPLMPLRLEETNLSFRFDLITFNTLDYRTFVNSEKPEEILLGLLGDFGNESPQKAVKNIIEKLAQSSPESLTFEKHIQQLRILAGLRNLQPLTEKLMESITKYFKEENDFLFQKGELKERQRKEYIFINSLLEETNFSDEKIALMADADLELVQKIRAEKEKEK
jgi:hypothetical protein